MSTPPGSPFDEQWGALLARLRDAPDAVPTRPDMPDLGHRVDRMRRARRLRRLLAVTAAACAVLGVVGGLNLARSGGDATEPAGTTRPPAVFGLLHPVDLGAGDWALGTSAHDVGTVTAAYQPGCQDATQGSGVALTRFGTGSFQVLRGRTPEDAPWAVRETLVRLDDEGMRAMRNQLAQTVGCRSGVNGGGQVLAANEIALVTTLSVGSDKEALSRVHAYAVSGHTWIALEVLPGNGAIALPGQTPWALGVLAKAVSRATGETPTMPEPTDEAHRMAAQYRAPTEAEVAAARALTETWAADQPTTPSTPPSQGLSVSHSDAGLLSLSDLTPIGAWRVERAATATATRVSLTLPASAPARVKERRVTGQGQVQTWTGVLGGTDYSLRETVVRDVAADAATFDALQQQSTFTDTAHGSMRWEFSNGVAFVNSVPEGPLAGAYVGWALRGDKLVQLELLPVAPVRTNPDTLQWTITALLTARLLA
ncbi:MAG: hypothetical protein WAL50_22535 [Kineosporiaceae bacterium]